MNWKTRNNVFRFKRFLSEFKLLLQYIFNPKPEIIDKLEKLAYKYNYKD